ncbi:hypothetical protein TRM7557_00349 [Tritonibacter multivorans]|uniref:Uncharacterized protein n=1 Tax=Tritonibacter multivorans TaxID=928856 RepID=A0A0P1G1E0_9RHOB|nr:hypothetical protein [Tritonibacter multivorans]MDA7419387.1 hypothetical protein [Tritonibacter multivorans]CUH75362.1 hypothetical protein TRM7557_00349 [Tritonibacter multivorans]SFD20667.1 hypothetical protein SAMN04488049_10911 [Tritonibacter multivorans]
MKDEVLVRPSPTRGQIAAAKPQTSSYSQRVLPQFSTPRLMPLGQLMALVFSKIWHIFLDFFYLRADLSVPIVITPAPAFGPIPAPRPAMSQPQPKAISRPGRPIRTEQSLTSLAQALDQRRSSGRAEDPVGPDLTALELRFYEQLLTRFATETTQR